MCFVSTWPLWQTQLRAPLMVFGISTYSNGALNPPRIVASAVAGVGVETVVPPLSTPPAVYGGRQKNTDHQACTAHASNSQRNNNSSPNHFHQHHCDYRCDCFAI